MIRQITFNIINQEVFRKRLIEDISIPNDKEKQIIEKEIDNILNNISDYLPYKIIDKINNRSYTHNDYTKIANYILKRFVDKLDQNYIRIRSHKIK